MQTRNIVCSLMLILCCSTYSWDQQERQKELSLEECIFHAIKNNLDVAVQMHNPELADISVSKAREKFMPSLNFSFNRRDTNSTSSWWIEAAERITTSYSNYAVQISQLIPTGGQFSVSLNTDRNDSNQSFQNINPRYGSTLYLSFSQPLLKDFGFKTSRKEILVAQNNMEISENDLKKVLLDTVYYVEEAYWNLVYSIETLKVKQQSLKLAQDLLEKNQKEVEIGTLAPKEILSAQAEVAAREADILQAKALVKDYSDLLKTLINHSDEETIAEIIPLDKPAFEKKERSLEEALDLAIRNRPDILSSRIDLKNKDIDLGYARNQLLPALNLNANYWSPGISGDRILYLNDNPFTGVIVGTIPGGASDALKDALNFKYRNWSVYLTLDIPLNTIFSRASVAQAKVSLDQAMVRLKNLEQKAFLEIKTAVRAVHTDYQRVEAYRIARELAEQKLEAEEAKLKVGLSTNFIVLQYQRDLSNARSAELKAVIDYNLSLSKLDKAVGINLQSWNIKLSDVWR
ncbi:MAG: TolC family protein [Candidatus Aminicenantes bacterium]|nr:TolC family protein [Candidatus Aminicenantes bacterium]